MACPLPGEPLRNIVNRYQFLHLFSVEEFHSIFSVVWRRGHEDGKKSYGR